MAHMTGGFQKFGVPLSRRSLVIWSIQGDNDFYKPSNIYCNGGVPWLELSESDLSLEVQGRILLIPRTQIGKYESGLGAFDCD